MFNVELPNPDAVGLLSLGWHRVTGVGVVFRVYTPLIGEVQVGGKCSLGN